MILDEIVLHNVGPFRSRNVLTLTPTDRERPITLIGGLNGNGKTTILESIHLCLYGRQASFCQSSDLPYDQQLARLIHRSVKPQDGACVEVAFRSFEGGREHSFRIKRYWSLVRDRLKEHVEAEVDGARDPGLSDSWSDAVQRFLPATLADLFFFDGERIEGFADPSRSGTLLASAIHSLLGVDLIQQLQADLDVLSRRRLKRTAHNDVRPEIELIEQKLSAMMSRRADLLQEEASRRAEAGQVEAKMRSLEELLAAESVGPDAKRRSLEGIRASVHAQLEATRQILIELAAGCLPLALLTAPLGSLLDEGTLEAAHRKETEIGGVLAERDDWIILQLEQGGFASKVVKRIREFLADDRNRRVPPPRNVEAIGVSDSTLHELENLLRKRLPEQLASTSEVLNRHAAQSESLDELDRRIAVAPTEQDAIVSLSRLEEAKRRFFDAQSLLRQAEEDRLKLDAEIQRLRDRELQLTKHQRETDEATQDAARFAKFAARGQDLLSRFRGRLIEQRVARLEQHILTGLKLLMRKDSLVHSARIDLQTCQLQLLTASQIELHTSRLSAGERQLLATAILWGLARASGRPVPVVIDTPLGRLDSKHRELLVERYFPSASHQVVLLSTDEEIDAPLLKRLGSHTARTYRLVHDDREGVTHIENGYFW